MSVPFRFRMYAVTMTLSLLAFVLSPLFAAEISTDLWVYNYGDTVTVTGVDYAPDETVEIVTTDPFGVETDRGAAQTDSFGGFTYGFVLLSEVGGIYDVVATGLSSGLSATTQFDPQTLTPSTVTYGGSTVSTGSTGAASSGTVTFTGHTTGGCGGTTFALGSTTAAAANPGNWTSGSLTPPSTTISRIKAAWSAGNVCTAITVSKANTSTTASASSTSIFNTQNFTVSYATSSTAGVAGNTALGNVSVAKLTGPGGSGTLGCSGSVAVSELQTSAGFTETGTNAFTCTPSGGAGTYTFRVAFVDTDGNYNNSNSTSLTVVVNPPDATSITETLTPSTITYGQSTLITGVLTDTTTSSVLVGFSVSDYLTNPSCNSFGDFIGSDLTNGTGLYEITYRPTDAGNGSEDIRAYYAGNVSHASASACATLTINRAPTVTTLALAETSITTLESTTASASVLSRYGVDPNLAEGTLSFEVFAATDCSGTALSESGLDEIVSATQSDADNNPTSEVGFQFDSVGTHSIGPLAIGSYGIRAFYGVKGSDKNYSDSSGCEVLTVIPPNTPPTVNAGGDYSGTEGSPIAIDGTATDDDGDILSYLWTIEYNSSIDAGGSCDFDDETLLDPTLTCDDDSSGGVFTLTLTVSGDPDGDVTDTADVTVDNANPFGAADNASVTVDEGDTANNTGTYGDAGANDSVALTASKGSVTDTGSGTWSWSFDSTDGPDDSATVTIYGNDSDGTGPVAIASFGLTVDNVDPEIQVFTISSPTVACQGGNNNVTVSFTVYDPAAEAYDPITGTIDWGDGSTPEPISGRNFTGVDALTHNYAAGTYLIQVSVQDDDSGTDSESGYAYVKYALGPFLPPLNNDGSSVFKFGSTVPVKIQVLDCNGSPVLGLTDVHIGWSLSSSATPGSGINETASTSGADTTGLMRNVDSQYLYNFATKYLPDSNATYYFYVYGSQVETESVRFAIRSK